LNKLKYLAGKLGFGKDGKLSFAYNATYLNQKKASPYCGNMRFEQFFIPGLHRGQVIVEVERLKMRQ
jgi:hypothetical protein